jgi:hypothetical protein
MAEHIILNFEGHFDIRKLFTQEFQRHGICIVYRGKSTDTITYLKSTELLYIGETENEVINPIKNKELCEKWSSRLDFGEKLTFTFADVSPDDIMRVKAELINQLKPFFT